MKHKMLCALTGFMLGLECESKALAAPVTLNVNRGNIQSINGVSVEALSLQFGNFPFTFGDVIVAQGTNQGSAVCRIDEVQIQDRYQGPITRFTSAAQLEPLFSSTKIDLRIRPQFQMIKQPYPGSALAYYSIIVALTKKEGALIVNFKCTPPSH